ncbi:PREDICTED: uncharacterized protein LOC104715426 [Camelina sativa]|uniref:Uncharacterized protein LOC104715426 n=1 Tax=Camelina sativa TaxID=90675 RepID=A0ABM0TTI4_CAMSA|nr:PREDICTED: uncharacterized protein LOC104715426 [Camelina sativa]
MDDLISQEEICSIERKLKEAYRDEEVYWQQKSRKFWLWDGDKNTKYFHASSKQWRIRNRITGLYGPDDIWTESDSGMEDTASHYFVDLFKRSDVRGVSQMLQEVPSLITDTMNRSLTREIKESEVRKALFAMHPEKTPGPEGMKTMFFQRFWSTIKGDLVALVKEFFRTDRFDPRLNETNICLIPKKDMAQWMTEFRPISLCDVCYKIISKEMFHGLNTNPRCKSEFLALKTDMSKAYDRVEWDFLETIMVLIANIKKAEREHMISGIKIAQDCPTISHLLFADDSLFFCKAEAAECSTVMDIIGDYGKVSGQEVNLEKSSIMFGKKVPPEVRTQLKAVMSISNEGGVGSYLGIPENLQGSKTKVFQYVSDRLDDRVNGWSAKYLSKGGKEVMIKSVALALPTHVMSCYMLPTELTSHLTSAISKFW